MTQSMTKHKRRWAPLAVIAVLCLTAGGCSSGSVSSEPTDLSVDIVVPYATATPNPETASGTDTGPLTISPNGDVTVRDTSWIDSGFAPAALEEAENYYTQLRLGDSGVEVRKLQTRLKELAYYNGEVSGVFDSATEDALKLFELSYGSMQTGIATARLQTLLYSDSAPSYNSSAYITSLAGNYTALEYGDTGPEVYALQERLSYLGYPIWDINGIFDDDTAAAVRLFYRAYNTSESVTASVAFQQELYSDGAKRYGSSSQITIGLGNIGTVVSELQETLISLGYLSGEPTGTYDEAMAEAVRKLQHNMGLQETGQISPYLRNLLTKKEFASEEDLANGIALNGTLRQGSKGEKVMALQRRLVELGYPYVAVTGTFDDATARAVSIFQGISRLEQTGMVSLALQEFIYSDNAEIYRATEELLDSETDTGSANVAFSPGMTGSGVRQLNTRLHALGYLDGTIGEEYDSRTEYAVKAFQAAIGVEQTGIVSTTLRLYLASNAAPHTGIFFYENVPPAFVRLETGDSGEDVTSLQRRLWDLGFLSTDGVKDSIGVYNSATKSAVTSAQRAMGYAETDGIAGVEFQAFLFSQYADLLNANQ